jgi:hypothetical protein
MAAPTFVDKDTELGATQTTVAFTWVNIIGEADDDVAIAFLYGEAAANPTGVPTGWTLYHTFDQSTGGFKYRAHVYWRRRAGDTGAVTFTFAGSVWRSGVMCVYRNPITTETPLLPSTPDDDIEAAQNTEPSHAGITVARSNSALLFGTWGFAASGVTTAPTGYTERTDVDEETHVWDDLTVTAGATGAVAADLVNPEYASSILIELITEAAAGGGATVKDIIGGGIIPWAR